MSEIIIPSELTGKELFKFLKENKTLLIAQKKYEIKKADSFTLKGSLCVNSKGEITKAINNNPVQGDVSSLKTALVINTTNWMDSHSDVHINGLWKKSLQENQDIYLLQEHVMSFENVISDNVLAFTKTMTWKSLGVDIEGSTQALVFNATIDKSRNPYMFDQYKQGFVKNHSVGMRYVKIDLAVNQPDDKYYADEFEVWEKYIDQVANKDAVEAQGYFWAVTEAKCIEGSAVVMGSNRNTPTLDNNIKNTPLEPSHDTHSEPLKSMIACPSCNKFFIGDQEQPKCPSCGQYVSPQSTSIEFDVLSAINQMTFI